MEIELVDIKTGETVLKWGTPDKCNASNSEVLRHKHRMYNGYILPGTLLQRSGGESISLYAISIQIGQFSDEEYFGDYVQSDGLG